MKKYHTCIYNRSTLSLKISNISLVRKMFMFLLPALIRFKRSEIQKIEKKNLERFIWLGNGYGRYSTHFQNINVNFM